ncbi:MAG: amidohydrolase family protein [Sphaerochaetaceae bacterium]|jgi:hypothetical protein
MKPLFFDAHMHAMNLTHPNFVSFVESIADNVGEFITSGALSPGYLFTSSNRGKQGFITLSNLFTLFERSIGEIFTVMEQDLKGSYGHKKDQAYIRDGKFHFREKAYDHYGLIPLVMDFSHLDGEYEQKAYYSVSHKEKILSYVRDTIEGIAYYQKQNKEGIFKFFPFLGINPEAHSLEFIKTLIDDNLPSPFAGIKFYPPLGTNPWPEDKEELKKTRYIYDYCVERNVGIISHCDDQGFRGVASKIAQHYTNPDTWKVVFKHYPTLKLDFAHYGRQYNPIGKNPIKLLLDHSFTEDPWFKDIMLLMGRYENIYADFSFSGTDGDFYSELHTFLEELEDRSLAEKIKKRSMFGSDFSINLAKVESYSEYLKTFETSPFSDEEIHLFASENPMRFLNLID